MPKPKVSLIIHTASADDFLVTQGIYSYFAALTHNLAGQSLQDFELVYVDTFYDQNRYKFEQYSSQKPFTIKHVPIHSDHRYWFDKGFCYISAAKNTGILYADGELCISCDDAEFFPDHLLDSYWQHYQSGILMHALHKRLKKINLSGEVPLPARPVSGEEYINDHRWTYVGNGQHTYSHDYGTLMFAGTSFPLAAAITINGFNERMDGCKSLEDCEFGMRMAMMGHKFIMDPQGYLYILDHPSYAKSMDCGWDSNLADIQANGVIPHQRRAIANFIAVENYGMACCVTELMNLVANRGTLSDQHMQIIQRETIKYRGFDPLGPANAANLEIWKGTPTFDLKQQRAELRASSEWKWQ